jgi:putative transcriptional regulator
MHIICIGGKMETAGNRLIQSLGETLDHAKGKSKAAIVSHVEKVKKVEIPASLIVREIREHLNMSQAEFAARFLFNLNTLRDWEHGRRVPDVATKAYLYAISKNAELIEQVLHS